MKLLRRALESERLGVLFSTAMTLALRPGEAIGLRWADVDFKAGTLRIEQTIQHVGGEYLVLPPKTDQARRTIVLPTPLLAELQLHRNEQRLERIGAREWTTSGLVFTNTRGTALNEPSVNRTLGRILERAGLPRLTFYELRHTGATAMLSLGVPLEQVQDLLGHTDIATTRIYAQVTEPLRREAAAKLEGSFL